ncbi:nitrile hydratase subunit alpha [Siccirubricoccus deserti]|uniref:Nitrile hydratase subunit alpha n=1 Tax=Siccirubricoccus deserti TaxID=2013562 RepID=A0A9X0QWP5_9PROT|nr:nitrile hydratase subunit alpha [Siccirubricoccus deserti]MBC4014268.1 nitrile hydratase subunit alpha [Siccirubricoccus deserti]GGC27929.1 nitrile hydratase subunit alpha [Siccirubricoccus deserti]
MSAPARPQSIAHLERLIAALTARGLVSEAELAARQASTDRASPEVGARMVARAWLDPEWRALMLRDGAAAAEQMGVSMAGAPPLGVLEDTPTLHHLVVCTLCSCYPRAVLGYPPSWYKSFEYRSRAVREPRAVLAEWGTTLPPGTRLRVVDSTADYRWMVLPLRPAGTEGWSEDRLAALVTRDALVGVALPQVPTALAAE